MATYRYLKNEKISELYLEQRLVNNCRQSVKGKRILVACDTTDYNLDKHKSRIKHMEGLGWMGDNSKIGFIHQGQLAIDRNNKKSCYGWAGSYFFKRDEPVKNSRSYRYNAPIEQKESYKWIGPSIKSRDEVLNHTKHVLYVMDREADIFEVMSRLPKENQVDVLIRIKQNRRLLNSEGIKVKLFSDLASQASKGQISISIKGDHRKRKKRVAKLEIRYATYRIRKSEHLRNENRYPSHIEMQAIEMKEISSSVPKGEKPITWRLWASEKVNDLESAIELIKCYKSRWYIEESFRLLKTEGFDIESTELESGKSIRKLLLIAMEASVKIMKLKSVRDGNNVEEIDVYFSDQEIEFLKHTNSELEGTSEKLKNPYSISKLSYASWIIARLGGWKGYASQRPPGTITYKKGLERFEIAFLGYKIAINRKNVCKR